MKKKGKTLQLKMGKTRKQAVTEEDIQAVNEHMRKWSASLAIMETN